MDRPKHGGDLVAQVLKGEGVANLFTLSGVPACINVMVDPTLMKRASYLG